jgi:glycosyltransferase involved in cell wall biosynthesis
MDLILNDNSAKITLCLNMIVKNESKIITRLFDSVLPIIDCYCICDTGSTDNTIDLIYEYFKNKGIPGKVVKEPFKNFCHNRNFALQSCLGMSDYVLLLDADMILEINNFDKS